MSESSHNGAGDRDGLYVKDSEGPEEEGAGGWTCELRLAFLSHVFSGAESISVSIRGMKGEMDGSAHVGSGMRSS